VIPPSQRQLLRFGIILRVRALDTSELSWVGHNTAMRVEELLPLRVSLLLSFLVN
jgi:hypothetical protein